MCYLMTSFWCPSDILIMSWLFTARWSTWPGNHLVPCVAELVGFRFMHVGVFLIQSASFIHLVCRCASLSTTFALSQSMTWFSSMAWSVMADLWVTHLSLALEARVCVPPVKRVHFFLMLLDAQTELPAHLSNIWAGAVLARDTIDQFGLLFILDLVLQMNHKVP